MKEFNNEGKCNGPYRRRHRQIRRFDYSLGVNMSLTDKQKAFFRRKMKTPC